MSCQLISDVDTEGANLPFRRLHWSHARTRGRFLGTSVVKWAGI